MEIFLKIGPFYLDLKTLLNCLISIKILQRVDLIRITLHLNLMHFYQVLHKLVNVHAL